MRSEEPPLGSEVRLLRADDIVAALRRCFWLDEAGVRVASRPLEGAERSVARRASLALDESKEFLLAKSNSLSLLATRKS